MKNSIRYGRQWQSKSGQKTLQKTMKQKPLTAKQLSRYGTETQASEAGVCRGSDTPTIYVGRYWYVYPVEKSNTEPCKLYATHTEMRKAIWRLSYKKTLRRPGHGSAPDPVGGAYSAPANPLAGGERLAAPKNPIPSSRPFGPRFLPPLQN